MNGRIIPLNGAIPPAHQEGAELRLIDYKITAQQIAPKEWLIRANVPDSDGDFPEVLLAGFEDDAPGGAGRFGRLVGLSVPPPFRKAGIGRKLMGEDREKVNIVTEVQRS